MQKQSMTALVSAFSRWYHAEHNTEKIFDDTVAGLLLSEQEKADISENMSKGIGFFNPTFRGTPDEALRWIVDNQLSPTPLGRAAFCEKQLEQAVKLGAKQYIIMAAGYDTFAYRQPQWSQRLSIIEIDHPATAQDKQNRLHATGVDIPSNVSFIASDFNAPEWASALLGQPAFNPENISFCSLLGLSYYLSKERFAHVLEALSRMLPKGSALVFDYPDQDTYTGRGHKSRHRWPAMRAKLCQLASYAYTEMESLLSDHHFLIYEHLLPKDITQQYFAKYNAANPTHPITAFDNVNYCLAVKT